jgi:5'-nucleotidase
MEVTGETLIALEYDQPDFSNAAVIAGEIIRDVLDNGMPKGSEILNVNFPPHVQRTTPILLTEVGRRKYTDKVIVRRDPRGRAYYWLFGERLSHFPPKTDAEAVLVKRSVSISPMVLNMSGPITESLKGLRNRVRSRLEKQKPAKRKRS